MLVAIPTWLVVEARDRLSTIGFEKWDGTVEGLHDMEDFETEAAALYRSYTEEPETYYDVHRDEDGEPT